MQAYLKELKAWLDSQREVPLEEMTAFFTQRLDGYDEHMLAHGWDHYRVLAQHVPEDAQTLLDLGCGTGLELKPLWQRLPDIQVTGIDLTRSMLDAWSAGMRANRCARFAAITSRWSWAMRHTTWC